MKKLKLLVFLFGLTIAISCGQQKRYVSYKIQEGETIEDVAKRLNMNEGDLLRLNPDVSENPEANTVIIIPNKKIAARKESTTEGSEGVENTEGTNEGVSEENTTDETYQIEITNYETHTIKQGETVYRITKDYEISKDELIKLNPEFPDIIFNKLSIGQVLKVKATTEIIIVDKKEILKNFITHEVESQETIYSLTRFYNVTKADLMTLNPEYPEIADDVLKIGQLIKIRSKNIEAEEEVTESKFYLDNIDVDETVDIAMLLPFRTAEYSSLSSRGIFRKNRLANMVTDFYLGAEIAIDSLKKQGVDLNVNIFDTGKKGEKIDSIISNNNLNDNDAIIGPFYSEEAVILADEVRAPIIFPHFSSSQSDFSSSKLVKSSPDKDINANFLLSYLKEIYNGETVFVVGDGEEASNQSVDRIYTGLQQYDSIKKLFVLKPEDNYIKRERFTDSIAENAKTWVIITSNDKVAIADAVNSTIGFPDGVSVKVFATDNNEAYNRIDNNKLADIGFTYVTNAYSNDDSKEVSIFNEKYLAKNNALPSDYAVKGFDITYDVGMRLASGKNLNKTFKEGTSFRLENKFDYKKRSSSFTNHGLFIVKYNPDLSLTRVR